MSLDEADSTLDGNAAAGLLAEIFQTEMTVSWAICAHCGAEDQLGHLVVYMRAPGTVFRCRICGKIVLRIVRARQNVWMDLSGVRRLILHQSEF